MSGVLAKAEAARQERIARITEHRQAFYAECAAKYRPRTLLEQSLDRVPDTITTMCGGCGATFEQPFGGPLDCPACFVGEAAAQIEELTDKVASLESDAKSVEDAEDSLEKEQSAHADTQARLDRAIVLISAALVVIEDLGTTDPDHERERAIRAQLDAFLTGGG